MKIEVETKNHGTFTLEGVEEVVNFDGGYHFFGNNNKIILFVPHENLAYYKSV